jgi:acetyl-CoA carboxylase biotin carboxylase subunit
MFVAQRGEIALRIIRACQELGIQTVLGASAADLESLPARAADRTVCIGPAPATLSYLLPDTVLHAAIATGCDALHPGYGFLSEVPSLAQGCTENGVMFVGPSPQHLVSFGDKVSARRIAMEAGVPLLPGSSVESLRDAVEHADRLGYPLLLKAAQGGGGKGIRIVRDRAELESSFDLAAGEALASFGDGSMYLERYVEAAKHVEVQLAGDRHGSVVHLGERECTVQYRYQKLIEESPCPALDAVSRAALCDAAVLLAETVGYDSLGTAEFLFDAETRDFYFLEVNARIQVEHPVTEAVTGLDLVQEQIALASGRPLSVAQGDVTHTGHAIECRVNAQSASSTGFVPSPGRITAWEAPRGEGIRVDSHCYDGYFVPPYYDSLLAKVVVSAPDRDQALDTMRDALSSFTVGGVLTSIPLQQAVLAHPDFVADTVTTQWLDENLPTLSLSPA